MPWGFRTIKADAEQEKHTGGMVALYPRQDEVSKLVVPGGEPPQDLHVTLAFLGDDVSGIDPGPLASHVDQLASKYTVITARIMGHALFNPDGGDDPEEPKEPCAVYLISDSEQLPELHSEVMSALDQLSVDFPLPTQHKPYIPHLTAGYSLPIAALSYTGPILFDRIGLAFAGHTQFFPLVGATEPGYSE